MVEDFDHAILKIPRQHAPTPAPLTWALVVAIAWPGLLPLAGLLSHEAVVAAMLAAPALALGGGLALGAWTRRRSAPYVEVKITDQSIALTTRDTIRLARDDIARLEETEGGLVVHTSGEAVTVFAGRPAEQTAWLKALLTHLSREDAAGGRAAIPEALAELGIRPR